MMGWYLLHPVISSVILMLLYLLLLIQMGCILAAFGAAQRKRLIRSSVPVFLITGTVLVPLRAAIMQTEQPADSIAGEMCAGDWGPAAAAAVLILLLSIWTCRIFRELFHYYQDTMTETAIKESIDNLPSGLAFSERNGFILLANRRMEALCRELAGTDFQNAEHFWEILEKGEVSGEPVGSKEGNTRSFRLLNGTVWTFEKKLLKAEEETVVQITAVNTTKLHQLASRLEENNRELLRIKEQLERYEENIEEFVHCREILETKIRIHDEMGQVLLASRSWLLKEGTNVEKEALLERWRYVIALLRNEEEPQREGKNWRYFQDAADFAGVNVKLTGKLPEDEESSRLLVASATEALTNAVRHAGADELTVCISETEKGMLVRFTNNGRQPGEEIREGGGLGALRLRVEEAGGFLKTEISPCFVLTVSIPGGRKGTW